MRKKKSISPLTLLVFAISMSIFSNLNAAEDRPRLDWRTSLRDKKYDSPEKNEHFNQKRDVGSFENNKAETENNEKCVGEL